MKRFALFLASPGMAARAVGLALVACHEGHRRASRPLVIQAQGGMLERDVEVR